MGLEDFIISFDLSLNFKNIFSIPLFQARGNTPDLKISFIKLNRTVSIRPKARLMISALILPWPGALPFFCVETAVLSSSIPVPMLFWTLPRW